MQLYVRTIAPDLKRPVRELKAFVKLELQPQETRTITLSLAPRDFR